jgi:hypothetical protein
MHSAKLRKEAQGTEEQMNKEQMNDQINSLRLFLIHLFDIPPVFRVLFSITFVPEYEKDRIGNSGPFSQHNANAFVCSGFRGNEWFTPFTHRDWWF